ncbi:MAG: response regulator [Bacteroidales bacterium]|nr:response regulator [Bacteroidales bacterium]
MAKKILIVEDDKMLLTIFQMFIQELGYEVAGLARTGEEALATASSNGDISCILMDIQLDGPMDGIATARALDKQTAAPVIFVSGGVEPALVPNCVLPNVYGLLTKPLYRNSLGMMIEFACAKYAMEH